MENSERDERIVQIEKIVGFNISSFLSERGQEQVIVDHMIDLDDMKKYCLIKSMNSLEPDDKTRERIALFYLQSRYPHNIIVNDLCNLEKYKLDAKEEKAYFRREFRGFEQMYQADGVSKDLFHKVMGNIQDYKNGYMSLDSFNQFVTTVTSEAEEVFDIAKETFKEKYTPIFMEKDIEVINNVSRDEDEEER